MVQVSWMSWLLDDVVGPDRLDQALRWAFEACSALGIERLWGLRVLRV